MDGAEDIIDEHLTSNEYETASEESVELDTGHSTHTLGNIPKLRINSEELIDDSEPVASTFLRPPNNGDADDRISQGSWSAADLDRLHSPSNAATRSANESDELLGSSASVRAARKVLAKGLDMELRRPYFFVKLLLAVLHLLSVSIGFDLLLLWLPSLTTPEDDTLEGALIAVCICSSIIGWGTFFANLFQEVCRTNARLYHVYIKAYIFLVALAFHAALSVTAVAISIFVLLSSIEIAHYACICAFSAAAFFVDVITIGLCSRIVRTLKPQNYGTLLERLDDALSKKARDVRDSQASADFREAKRENFAWHEIQNFSSPTGKFTTIFFVVNVVEHVCFAAELVWSTKLFMPLWATKKFSGEGILWLAISSVSFAVSIMFLAYSSLSKSIIFVPMLRLKSAFSQCLLCGQCGIAALAFWLIFVHNAVIISDYQWDDVFVVCACVLLQLVVLLLELVVLRKLIKATI